MQTSYKVVDWPEANDLKLQENTRFLMPIEFNLSQVYRLKDSSYLIMPLNPFGKSLITKDKALLDKWINDRYFPTNKKVSNHSKDDKILDLLTHKEELKRDLFKFLSLGETIERPEELDQIYNLLKKRKAFEKFKFQFIVLVGDYLIRKDSNSEVNWGFLEVRQLLTPITQLILIKEQGGETKYFKLEDLIAGKWGYSGMQGIEHSYEGQWARPNEINSIRKINYQ